MKSNLANAIRPDNLDNFICDENLRFLFESIIEKNDFRSFIFYGKPGTGKTTISYILAKGLKVSFEYFNAAVGNKDELIYKLKTNKILIIDEIHRLNKDKQDILLPYLENDLITIYATTTENPYFKLNPALRSRASIIEFKKPTITTLIENLKKIAQNLDNMPKLSNEIYKFIAEQANGDFRVAINNLELIFTIFAKRPATLAEIKKIIPATQFASDSKSDNHYDYLSAFHKSLRGSDPDGALYWGMIIIKSGDFDGLFRRLMCATYEDVGLANPKLGPQVMAAIDAFERLGMPEGYLPLSNAIINIAISPKSNSTYLAVKKIASALDEGKIYEVPNHLKDANYASAKKLGRGIDYQYPHDFKHHYVKQTYLPNELVKTKFFEFQDNGYEEKIKNYWNSIKNNTKG
ncbi:AAA family ATPase [[Mycoplasma] phocae]|uniref:AAA family ATPase n=1 Tax=[Mycoplasma] phocae TaxID=142651 RepID=A0A2Z5IQ94_9BACT|nr:replication-associated recombination protein A [[Mycoplasma] phocae]AXE60889.1 AAA family ATPase [[Mycoplasma] phocae]